MRKMLRGIIWLVVSIFITTPVIADDMDSFRSCVGLTSDLERLQCFDTAAAQFSAPADIKQQAMASCRRIDFGDLQLDISILTGECITTIGYATIFGEIAFLSKSQLDSNPIAFSYQELPRDQRKLLLGCSVGCRIQVTGVVESVMFQPGVRATNVQQP